MTAEVCQRRIEGFRPGAQSLLHKRCMLRSGVVTPRLQVFGKASKDVRCQPVVHGSGRIAAQALPAASFGSADQFVEVAHVITEGSCREQDRYLLLNSSSDRSSQDCIATGSKSCMAGHVPGGGV